jgi:hypothetical protein
MTALFVEEKNSRIVLHSSPRAAAQAGRNL